MSSRVNTQVSGCRYHTLHKRLEAPDIRLTEQIHDYFGSCPFRSRNINITSQTAWVVVQSRSVLWLDTWHFETGPDGTKVHNPAIPKNFSSSAEGIGEAND